MNKLQAMALAAGLSGLVTGLETDLIQNIAAYLLAGKIDSDASKWKIRKLSELGKLNQKNIETISSYIEDEKALAELTVKTAAVSAMSGVESGFRKMVINGLVTEAADGSMEKTMEATIKTLFKQAKSELNVVNTTMLYKAKDAAGKVIRNAAELANKQEYLDMLGKAAGKTVTGTEAMTTAVSKCLKEMAEKGLPGFVDSAGREWTPEAYVNMCVRATAKNTATKAVFDRMEDYGLHIVEISSHNGARPKCAKDQGKLFDLNNESGYVEDGKGNKVRYYPWSSSSYGQPDGILGINCGHDAYPFTPGASVQRFFPYDEEENDKLYKAVQKQRELERKVRASKRACSALKDGDPEMFKKASVQLKQRSQALKDYCAANDLMYMNERTSVLGFGKSEAGKVTAAYKKALKEQEKSLDKLTNGGIIKGRGSGLKTANPQNWKQNAKRVGSIDVSDEKAVIETMERFEEKYRNKEREYCMVISRTGDVYLARGDSGNVDTTELLGKKIMNGSWNSHNHPPGAGNYTFSISDDIPSFWDDGSQIMRATDEKYTYQLIRPKKLPSLEEFKEQYYINWNNRLEILDNNKVSMMDFEYNEIEVVMATTCKHFNIDYRRWEND
ncbi:MAG: phage minor capsid protein [Ruminiclostridium sp.]